MFQKKRLLAGALALATCVNLVTVGAFARGESRSTSTQTSSPEETVYVNSYGGDSRTVDFNDHWRFNLGSGSEATDYNDSTWTDVDLPHDYSIEQDYTSSGEAESGYLLGGTGWYRKTFSITEDWKDKVITINFGGVYMNATVYLNGHELGFHPYGYTAFAFELPQEYLNYEGDNVLAVKVEHQTPSSRWYSGSGIYRSVHLTITDPVHVDTNGTYITTPNLAESNGADGTVNVVTTVANQSGEAVNVVVRQTIYESGSDAAVATVTGESVTVDAGSTQDVTLTTKVDNPKLWDTDNPNLYDAVTEVLVDDQVVDTYTTEFGFRWLTFNNDTTGFELNGVPTKLKGVCMHHDQGALGSEAWYRAIERQVEILKEMGCNAIRVTHNPASDELVEIANRLGIMLIDEAFDTWTNPKNGNTYDYSEWFNVTIAEDNNILGGETGMTWAEYDIKAMVERDKNAPAVIMYSLGNEIFEGLSYADVSDYPQIARNLCTWLQEVDTTRPVTFGQNSANDSMAQQVAAVINEFGGVVGLNYASTTRYDSWVAQGLKVYYSETASAVNSRGVYDRKASASDGGNGDYLLTSYDKSAVSWGTVASDAWWRVLERDTSMGEFVWTGFDYIGEPTPWNGTGSGAVGTWPSSPKSSYFGIIDTNGLPKDSYYLYQSMWNEDVTTLHVLPTWNEEDVVKDSSGKVEVVVYSDAPVVKLYLNGEEVGTAKTTETTTEAGYTYRTFTEGTGAYTQSSGHQSLYATFMVTYASGTLEAKAFEADGVTPITDTEGRSVVKTTSDASQLTLSADRDSIVADGDDLSYITIDVRDADGNLVNTDDVNVQLSIEGEGTIVGVDNGRQSDHTSYQSLSRNVGAGQLVAIVQSTDKAGTFTVTATADGLTAGSVTVTTTAPDTGEGEDNPVISYDISRYHYVKVGNAPVLPETVVVTYKDGTTKELGVTWNAYDESLIQEVGSFTISGVIDEVNVTTTVNINMLDQVAALLNYSTAVRKDSQVTLPSSRPAVLEDGTILNAEFPVEWDIPDDLTATVGTKVVQGTSQVFGEEITVTASVRVAEGEVTIGGNVASAAADLTQSIPEDLQSDTLEAIRDGSTEVDPNLDGGPNESTWSNYDSAQAGNKSASLTFRYDTAQFLGQVVLYFATDSFSAALPSDVQMEVSQNGEQWTTLDITAGEATNPSTNVTRIAYTFEPQDAVFFRLTLTNKEGDPASSATSYCVSLTEVELNVAQTSFAISDSDALTGITVNGKAWNASQLAARSYSTEALLVDTLEIESGNNASYTVIPAVDNVVKILTESEDHSTRGVYTINLDASSVSTDPTDDSRDYPYTQTTATAASAQSLSSGVEGPVELAVDNNAATYWHTNWSEYLENSPEKRWIQLELEEATVLDALRYQPRPTVANGIVTEYRVEVSMTGEDGSWTTVATGTWAHDTSWKIAVFDQAVEAKYVRLYGVQTRGGTGDIANRFMSCAELRVRVAEEKIDLSDATVTLENDVFAYTGSAIEPMPTVVLGDKTLKYGVDYAVDYANNVEPGTATLTVRGIVDYSGTVEKTFTISQDVEPETYTVTVNTQGEGTATAEPTTATAGTTVTLTQTAAEGWHFVEWQSEDVTVTDNTFVMPEGNVTVTAVFEEDETPAPSEVNKTLLEKTVAYAETLSTDGVTDSAKAAFETALENAKTVLANDNATQDEVNAAWNQLLEGIWGLGLVQGDKAELNQLIAKAEDMVANADKYVETNWQQLVDALAAAKDVAADGDAMDSDIQPAAQALLDAILAQRFKADKSILEDLINQAEGINLTGYTEESVAVFRTALANAQAVMADATLSEDDQKTVDDAVAALQSAMDGLTAEGEVQPSEEPEATDTPEATDEPQTTDQPETTDEPQASQSPEATQKPDDSPAPTGDTNNVMVPVIVVVVCVVALLVVVVVARKRKH